MEWVSIGLNGQDTYPTGIAIYLNSWSFPNTLEAQKTVRCVGSHIIMGRLTRRQFQGYRNRRSLRLPEDAAHSVGNTIRFFAIAWCPQCHDSTTTRIHGFGNALERASLPGGIPSFLGSFGSVGGSGIAVGDRLPFIGSISIIVRTWHKRVTKRLIKNRKRLAKQVLRREYNLLIAAARF